MKFKKRFLPIVASVGLLVPTMVSPLATTSCSSTKYEVKTQKDYDVVDSSFVKETSAKITFFKNYESIPYISLKEAFELLKFERSKYFTDNLYNVTIKYDGAIAIVTREANNGAVLKIDANKNTATFSDFGKFMTQGVAITESYVRNVGEIEEYTSTEVNYIAYGATKQRIKTVGSITLDLGHYNIDVINYNNENYLPFPTFSDMFLSDVYKPLVVLKNAIVCMYDQRAPRSVPEFLKQNALDVTQELLQFNYNETCFFLDTYYGFVEKRSYPSFDKILTYNGLKDKMLTSVQGVDEAINFITANIFDDSHSAYLYDSPSNSVEYKRVRGPWGTKISSELWHYSDLRDEAYPQDNPWKGYEEIKLDDETNASTAVITFDGFTELTKEKDWYQTPPASLEDVGDDAIGLFLYSYSQIKNNSNIKNIVVDLSCNGGGDERCLAFISAMISGGQFTSSYKNTVDKSINICTFYADANLDHKIDEEDELFKEKEVFVLASPFSFSCANALPLFTYDSDNIQLIGKRSGGGACVVYPAVTALGTSYQISGIYELGKVINGSYYDGDKGIDPVINVDDSIYFSNGRKDLVKYIKSLQPQA